ncbi:MAG: glycosyltransferase family 39 protein [Mariniblastus sp.]|nr:glycosyltransferase family 39 protein [Mariniblastus sp.]
MTAGSDQVNQLTGSRQTALHLAIITLFAGAIFFTNLGSARLWDRDEPRNAGCASEMLQRGDWVVPIFNNELRQQKPVLLYWFMMSAFLVLGETELAARIWSAILGLGTVWMTYGIARRLVNPTVGLLAAMALSTSIMFSVAARAATPDSVLIFFSTLAILLYVLGTFARQRENDPAQRLKTAGCWFPQHYGYVVGMYSAMAMGVLAKGPVGLILPTAIIGMFLLLQRLSPLPAEFWNRQGKLSRLAIGCFRPFAPWHFIKTCWSMRPLTAIALVLIIAGPWYVLVGLKTEGDFLEQFLLGENFGRATTVLENHRGGLWFYPLTLLIGFFPWAIFCFPTLLTIDRQMSQGSKYRTVILFTLCWVLVQISLFTIASTKLPSYVTPCYPALAILVGMTVHSWLTGQTSVARFWYVLAVSGLITAGLIISIGLFYVGQEFLGGDWSVAAIGLIPLLGGLLAVYFAWTDQRFRSVITVSLTSFLFSLTFFGFGTTAVDAHRLTSTVLEPIRQADPAVSVASFQVMESSWVVYSGRPIFELASSNEATGRNLERDRFWQRKPRITPEEFSQLEPGAFYLTTNQHVDELLARLPDHYEVAQTTPFFLKKDVQLVLLQPAHQEKTASERDDQIR